MTSKTLCVADRGRLESSLFEPETVANIGGRFGGKFIVGISLRQIRLMANRTARFFLPVPIKRRFDKAAPLAFVLADNFDVFLVREKDFEIGNRLPPARRLVINLARIRKRKARAVSRRRICVANRADGRRRTAEKLFAVAIDTGFVFRIFGHVGKCGIAFSDLFPVFRRKSMTRDAGSLVRGDGVRKLRISSRSPRLRSLSRPRLSARLRCGFRFGSERF